MKRRDFIKSSVASSAALATAVVTGGLSGKAQAAASNKAMIQRVTQLGNTDMKISDISFGAGRLPSASMILRAIDRGINYFDTAPDYGPSEDYIGKALTRFKQRDKIYIASKFCHPIPYSAGTSHLQTSHNKADYIASVENSLKRMGTDYLDVVFVHAMGELADYDAERSRLLHPEMLEAFESLKKSGKARYLAVSSHGPHNMEKLMLEAVRSGHYHVIMPAFNFMKFPKVPELLKEARKKGVGVVAMKTLAGAKEMPEITEKGLSFEHSAFKWVLKHPEVAGLVITIKTVKDLDNYVQASGQAFAKADQNILDQYAVRFGNSYCRTGCGDCQGACPSGVDVATILRYQMYFQDYGDQKQAMLQYAQLNNGASACDSCDSTPCVAACDYGLPVASKLMAAHRTLSFTNPVV
ncbi:MAG: aldo/keto reductase [Magnetococcales bacterium]|nr:aldo/keto reductase [Magnetococcales bacterium]